MPIFEYQCPNGHTTEVIDLQSRRAEAAPCSTCGVEATRQPFSRTNWQIGEGKKGSPIGEAIKRVKARGL